VISWIVTIAGGLSIIAGLAMAALIGLSLYLQQSDALDILALGVVAALGPIVGGAVAVYFGICGILRKPSRRFTLPRAGWFAALTVLALTAGVVSWHLSASPAPAWIVLPLLVLSGVLPALAILALGAWQLHLPSTRRHVWMSLIYGATVAPLLAIVLEVGATIVIALVIQALGRNGSYAFSDFSSNPQTPLQVVILLLTISVAAPIVEEGVKPLGAVLIMRRIKTPASAFLIGLAAGVGFDIFETIGYIGSGGADWVTVAIERVGAGLLHGLGAGMAALGWYYLINGRGVRWRWLRGFSGILYAIMQHALFNGSNLLLAIPGPFGNWMAQPYYLDRLPIDRASVFFFAVYLVLLGILLVMSSRLRRIGSTPDLPPGTGPTPPDDTGYAVSRPTQAGSVA